MDKKQGIKRPAPPTNSRPYPNWNGPPPQAAGPAPPVAQPTPTSDPMRLPKKLERVIPESSLFTELQQFERSLDTTLAARRMDVVEFLRPKLTRTPYTLRLCLSTLTANQEGSYHVDPTMSNMKDHGPTWTLRMDGTIREQLRWNGTRKFTSFFKRVFVQLDPSLFPQNDTIEWQRTGATSDTDCFEIKRPGNQDTEVKLILEMNHQPQMFKLSSTLQKATTLDVMEKSRVTLELFQYIKGKGLQDPIDKKTINCDATFRDIFGTDKIQYTQIPHLIQPHLTPADPIEITYSIKINGNVEEQEQYYDIPLFLEESMEESQSLRTFQQQMLMVDNQINMLITQINMHRQKMDYMLRFSEEPVRFINRMIASHIHDAKMTGSSDDRDEEQQRYADFYYQPFVNDAVHEMVNSTIIPQMNQDLDGNLS
ncbi:SWI/SNF transcription activation complex subunit [Planoprotostelium fungivorum]|uniref:SWI/SNF transcription activation complex subunit n=1 Tax=Planoprotostelium fungivorum TaxID=1890364 RepID=A0A2P6NSX0_9EUKA|nr:SWI/SNF transcription activation complex subunit [Planoprotostelium fungivorum]